MAAAKVPSWQGRFPFPPESKIPCKINYSNQISTIYGNAPHQNIVNKYVSSDRLTVGDFIVFSGGYFEPPGYHAGDEIYYIRHGQATVTNPETGETHLAREGDGFVISQNTWHQVFNYEKEDLIIFTAHAPTLYSKDDMGAEIIYLKKYAYLSLDASAKRSGDFRQSISPEFSYRLYEFPVNGKIAREKKQIVHVPQEKFFHFVCGQDSFIRRSFIVSNDYVHTSLVKMFSGGVSDYEVHQGDEVINVIEGEMNVEIAKEEADLSVSAESFNLKPEEKVFIPENIKHRFLNLHGSPALFYSCIAPKI
jgi:mannose-6-phosphate isomerase-like protein (cupin superfamily)